MGLDCYYDFDYDDEVCYSYDDSDYLVAYDPSQWDQSPNPDSNSIDLSWVNPTEDSTDSGQGPQSLQGSAGDAGDSLNGRSVGGTDPDNPVSTTDRSPASLPFSLSSNPDSNAPYHLIDPEQINSLGGDLGNVGYYSTQSALMVLATGKDSLNFGPSEEGTWAGLTGAAAFGLVGGLVGGPAAAESMGEVGFELGMGLYETYEDLTNRAFALESLLNNFDAAEQSNTEQGGWPTPMPGPTPAPEANPSPVYSAPYTPDMISPGAGILK